MNTIDPNFFNQAVSEIEMKMARTDLKSEGVITVQTPMFSMLEEYVKTHKRKNKRTNVSLVKQTSRKRKRSELRQSVEISTVFGKSNKSRMKLNWVSVMKIGLKN